MVNLFMVSHESNPPNGVFRKSISTGRMIRTVKLSGMVFSLVAAMLIMLAIAPATAQEAFKKPVTA